MSETKKGLCICIVSITLFIILMILLKTVNVKEVEGIGKIGLYGFNNTYKHDLNKTLDIISDVLLYISIAAFLASAVYFMYKLIKNKFKQVDYRLLVYFIIAVCVVITYLVFDHVIKLNNRPNIIDGELEGSFPSTHVLLATYFLLPLTTLFFKEGREKDTKKIDIDTIITTIAFAIIGAMFVLRLWSGMHWMTDCIGGVLLGAFYFGLYYFITSFIKSKKSLE